VATKRNRKTFRLKTYVRLLVERTVEAETLTEAMELGRQDTLDDIVKTQQGVEAIEWNVIPQGVESDLAWRELNS
jgi:hypothetical protein